MRYAISLRTPFSRSRLARAFVLASAALVWCNAPGRAQSAVGVTPSNEVLSAEPGASIGGTISLANPANSPLLVRTTISDWDYDASGNPEFFEANSLAQSAADWLTIDNPEFKIDGSARQDVAYEVQVPKDAAPGTYWAAALFEAEDPDPAPGDTLAAFRIRVAFGLYVNVGAASSDATIAGMIGERTSGASYELQIRIANHGAAMAALTGHIDILDATGATPVTIPVKRVLALPHGERLLKANVWGPLPAGAYSALIVLNDGDATTDFAGQYDFALDRPLASNPSANASGAAQDAPASRAQ